MSTQTEAYVAFLRGINVGGNNIVSMSDLKSSFEQLGFSNVKTFGNSGNIIFTADSTNSKKLEAKIEPALEKHFTNSISVLVRSKDEIEKVISEIPKNWNSKPDTKYDIVFLKESIDTPDLLKSIDPIPELEDLTHHRGVLFWSVHKKNFGKSNFPKVIGTKLYKGMSIRTSGVVRKVYEMMKR